MEESKVNNYLQYFRNLKIKGGHYLNLLNLWVVVELMILIPIMIKHSMFTRNKVWKNVTFVAERINITKLLVLIGKASQHTRKFVNQTNLLNRFQGLFRIPKKSSSN